MAFGKKRLSGSAEYGMVFSRMSKFLGGILVLLCLVLLSVGMYFGLRGLIQIFASLDPQVAKVTAIACSTVILSALILASSAQAARGSDMLAGAQMQKADLYRDFIQAWSKALCSQGRGGMAEDTKLAADLASLEKRLVLLASAGVIKHYTAWRARCVNPNADDAEARRRVAQVLFEMRKDLGRQNLGIDQKKLLDLLLRDGSSEYPAASKDDRGGGR